MVNPATGEVIAKVPHAKGPETRAAIAEAAAVFPKWSGLPAKERSKILRKCACSRLPISIFPTKRRAGQSQVPLKISRCYVALWLHV